jgi:hypothetical protein
MGGEGKGRGLHAQVAMAGGILVLAGLPLPWISAGVGPEEVSSRGFDLIAACVPVASAALAICAFAAAWWWTGRDRYSTYTAFAAGFLCLLLLVTLIAVESASGLIPVSFLPDTMRRSAGVIAAGAGVWISLAGCALALFAASPAGSWVIRFHTGENRTPRPRLGAALLLLILTVVVGWLRYQPWIGSSVVGTRLELSGQSAPWVGPASLFAVCLLGGAVLLFALCYFEAAGLLAAGSGWLISFLAAVTAITSESLARFRLDDLAESVTGQSVTFHATPAVWGTYLFGLLIAGVGGWLVWWRYESGGDECG